VNNGRQLLRDARKKKDYRRSWNNHASFRNCRSRNALPCSNNRKMKRQQVGSCANKVSVSSRCGNVGTLLRKAVKFGGSWRLGHGLRQNWSNSKRGRRRNGADKKRS